MAIQTKSTSGVDARLGCYFVDAHYSVTAYLDAVSWGRDTGNAARSKLSFTLNANLHYDTLVWAGTGNFSNNQVWAWTNLETKTTGNRTFPKGGNYCTGATGCCYCHCGGNDWRWSGHHGYFNGTVLGDANTTQFGFSAQYLGTHTGNGFYNLPDNLRVLPPVGLSVSWPTMITGSASASISRWSNNPNIGGTPTSYPGHSYWTFAIDLLDENGNYLAHKTFNNNEAKSCSFGSLNSGWYTASALSGTSGAAGSAYNIEAGKKYRFRVVVQNNMNQRIESTSGVYVSSPPKPKVTITSTVYDPSTKKVNLCFNWSVGASALTPEVITYNATLPDGTSVASGTLKTISNGAASSGSKCIVVPTGDLIKVTVTNTAGTSPNQMTATGSASAYAPVANAAFLGFDWDELRRTCTIRAEAPGAANCRIEAGYQANNFDIGNKLTAGEIGELVVKDLNHGSGQILYLQATPESSNGHKYVDEIAKISIPIPNPILGVYTPKCGSPGKQQYIVDIIEKKKDTCVVTPKWQNGDRVVKIGACGGEKMLLE